MTNYIYTTTNTKPTSISLKDISEAMKKIAAIAAIPDTREEDKILGIKAASIKFLQPENYRKMNDEDKALIDEAIERAAYINRMETLEKHKLIGNY